MKMFQSGLAVAAVALGFAGAASAADPVKKGVIDHGGVAAGGVKILPHPYPNPGPFPPKPHPVPPRVDFDFVVAYKPSVFAPPRVYGKFETLNAARFAALRLESFGYPVQVVPVRDFRGGWGW